MTDVREIELAVEHFASNQEFIRLYNRHNRELLLQHFLLIAAAGNEVWTANQERKMSMPEQRDLMLVKYMEWLEKLNLEFPEVEKPFDVSEDWWRLMLLAYERKPISGKSLWRKFKEDTRNPILSSFNCHWAEPRESETLEDRFRVVRRGVWNDLGHRDDEFLHEGSWLPKQWYAWRYCCYPGKNFRAFDGKLPSMPSSQQRQRSNNNNNANGRNNNSNLNGNNDINDASVNWGAALPINAAQLEASLSSVAALQLGAPRPAPRANRANLPSTGANQRLLQAAASMSRVRGHHPNSNAASASANASSHLPNPLHEDELSVQHYLAEVQQYMAQMTRLEKAAALAEAFGEPEKAAGFKRQLYEHVQTDPPGRLKRPNNGTSSNNLQQATSSLLIHQNSHSSQSSGNSHNTTQSVLSGISINNNSNNNTTNHVGNGGSNGALDVAHQAHGNHSNNHTTHIHNNNDGNVNSSLSHSNSGSGSGGGGGGGGGSGGVGGEILHSQPVHAHIPASVGGGQSSSSSTSGSSGNNSINNNNNHNQR